MKSRPSKLRLSINRAQKKVDKLSRSVKKSSKRGGSKRTNKLKELI